jgi:GAF domain-containing protein
VTDLGVRAYAGMPLVVAGQVLGAFGAIDTVPRAWTVHELGVLGRLAGAAGDVLALRAGSADALVGEALDLSVLRRLPGLRVSRPGPRRAGPRRPAPGPS